MRIEPRTLKGFRDFLPKDSKKRNYVLGTLKKVFESYGFDPLETPVLEYEDILAGKYGEEGEKLMYRFTDNGERRVAMRYDQTVPLARVMAQYANDLPLPFKRYQIQNVFRAENTQKGRYREFLQVDIDTIGSTSLLADAEIITVAINSFKKILGEDKNYYPRIRINDRKLLDSFGLSKKEIIAIDKKDKSTKPLTMLLTETGTTLDQADLIVQKLFDAKPTEELKSLFDCLKNNGLIEEDDFVFDQYLARGLDYYTGPIFELQLVEKIKDDGSTKKYDSKLSLGGGGRYDELIGMFSKKSIPAVGFSFGFDRIIETMTELNLFPEDLAGTKLLITNSSEKSTEIANDIRKKGINVELFIDKKDLDKQLKYADKKGIPFVLIVEESKLTLKNMTEGNRKEVTLENLPNELH